jgi:hypothetical protein
MKIRVKPPIKAQIGDVRTVTHFLLWPIKLQVGEDGPWEWRWLERASLVQQYTRAQSWLGNYVYAWDDLHWSSGLQGDVITDA